MRCLFPLLAVAFLGIPAANAQPDADRFLGARRDACLEKSIYAPDQRIAAATMPSR